MTKPGEAIRDSFWAFGIAAVIVATLSQWHARYADPSVLSFAGVILGLAVIFLQVAESMQTKLFMGLFAFGALALVTLGAATLAMQVSGADQASVSNDRRCLAIQTDMLSASPRRSDGPDLFQALGCRPQGVGNVYAPARSPSAVRETAPTERKK